MIAHNYVYSHIIMCEDYENWTQIPATEDIHIQGRRTN